jgi:hypothetical protein
MKDRPYGAQCCIELGLSGKEDSNVQIQSGFLRASFEAELPTHRDATGSHSEILYVPGLEEAPKILFCCRLFRLMHSLAVEKKQGAHDEINLHQI